MEIHMWGFFSLTEHRNRERGPSNSGGLLIRFDSPKIHRVTAFKRSLKMLIRQKFKIVFMHCWNRVIDSLTWRHIVISICHVERRLRKTSVPGFEKRQETRWPLSPSLKQHSFSSKTSIRRSTKFWDKSQKVNAKLTLTSHQWIKDEKS